MRKDRVWKSHILLIMTRLARDGDSLRVVGRTYENISGHDLDKSLDQEEAAGIYHKIEVVNEPPQKFNIGTLYVSYNGKRIWIFTEVSE